MTFKERVIAALKSHDHRGRPGLVNSKEHHEELIREFIDAIESLPERDPNPKPRKYYVSYAANRRGYEGFLNASGVYTINDGREFIEDDLETLREWAKNRHEGCTDVVIGTIFELAS